MPEGIHTVYWTTIFTVQSKHSDYIFILKKNLSFVLNTAPEHIDLNIHNHSTNEKDIKGPDK